MPGACPSRRTRWSSASLHLRASRIRAPDHPSVGYVPLVGLADRQPGGPASGHQPPCRAFRPRGHRRLRGQGGASSTSRCHEYRLLRDLDQARHARRSRRSGWSPRGSTTMGIGSTRLLITRHLQFSLPYRSLFQPRCPQGHGQPARRRDGGATGSAAPDRLPLGRRVALQHAVPSRRRVVRGLPRRRRDRASYTRSLSNGQREHDLADRPYQPLRGVLRPGGRRTCSTTPWSRWSSSR